MSLESKAITICQILLATDTVLTDEEQKYWQDKLYEKMVPLKEAQKLDYKLKNNELKATQKVATLNRLIRQHPESPAAISWFALKEYIETEVLMRKIDYEDHL